MKFSAFTRENPPLALFAPLAIATSGFGQTFFVSIFGAGIRGEFSLSNSAYGSFYGLATLCSALLLLKLGGLADRWALSRVTLLAVLLLCAGCLVIGLAPHWILLIPGFLLVRLGGQGMLSHLGMTVAGRYFLRSRGKIMALTAAGFPVAEAVLPNIAGVLLIYGGWRLPWLAAAGGLLLIALPLLLRLSRHAAHPVETDSQTHGDQTPSMTRGEALRDPGFYLVLPAALVTPFIVTAILFHQATIAEIRQWPTEVVGLAFTGFALGHFCSLFVAGPMIDRWGASRTLPLALAPLFSGLLVLGLTQADWTPYLYLALTGSTLGAVGAAAGALWPERYGTRHIGSIRSVAQAAMVFSTAVSPLLVGVLLDAELSPSAIALMLAALVAFCVLLTAFVRPLPTGPKESNS